jgi:hypothetical protein
MNAFEALPAAMGRNPNYRPTLASQGMDENLAHQARTLGAMSEEKFEAKVAEASS